MNYISLYIFQFSQNLGKRLLEKLTSHNFFSFTLQFHIENPLIIKKCISTFFFSLKICCRIAIFGNSYFLPNVSSFLIVRSRKIIVLI